MTGAPRGLRGPSRRWRPRAGSASAPRGSWPPGSTRDWPAFLLPSGRILVPEAPTLPAPVAALVGTATPLQLVTERLARARGSDPDPIRRDQLAYREAATLAD